ncbi:MAG: energy-coupling factor transporter ATPase, partial [Firmicutes bacterium]|nr:energy-coupling factor transporter ATPase [Bacillota bacterium]
DPAGRDEIYSLLMKMHREFDMTVVLVSHSMEDIARLTQRVVVMNNGSIEMDGDVRQVFRKGARLEQIGLSVPQISYLMKRLKSVMPGINEDIITIEEAGKELLKFLEKSRQGGIHD